MAWEREDRARKGRYRRSPGGGGPGAVALNRQLRADVAECSGVHHSRYRAVLPFAAVDVEQSFGPTRSVSESQRMRQVSFDCQPEPEGG